MSYSDAATALKSAKSLIITAGAGMGVDSGLPDFRGDTGFWKAYPLYENLGLSFVEMANPEHFRKDPPFAWGFYGHRTNLYRETIPHAGFGILLKWIREMKLDSFVITSNVDGQFQKAGFDENRIVEVHGSIHHMQCQKPCKPEIWPHDTVFEIDFSTMRAQNLPKCINCGSTCRPNVLMFNDWFWVSSRSDAQQRRFNQFISDCSGPCVVIEMGAGTAVPTIRFTSQRLGNEGATVIRINPREAQITGGHLSFSAGALEALQNIDSALATAAT